MKIGKRLDLISRYIKGYDSLIDVGCDHAYLPIFLVKNGYIKKAIACDINIKPLEIAYKNIKEAGLENKIVTTLSDGLENIKTDGYDILSICGMGGLTIKKIIDSDKIKSFKRIVISAHSEEEELLDFIKTLNLNIVDEDYIYDKNKPYHIIILEKGVYNYFYGKYLRNNIDYIHFLDERITKFNLLVDLFKEKEEAIPDKIEKQLKLFIKRRQDVS